MLGDMQGVQIQSILFKVYETSKIYFFFNFFLWRSGPMQAMASSFLRFLDHTRRRMTVSRIPLDE